MLRPGAIDDGMFEDFQHELESLETFRDQYRSLYAFAGLDRDDPDVQRMIEAMAFFSARTRREAERALVRHERRALEQLFPYLLSPMPSMALLSVEGARAMADAKTIPAGTEILVNARPDPGTAVRTELSYRTLRPLRVRPIDVDPASVELVRLGQDGWELRLTINAASPQIEPMNHIELTVNPQGDLVAAMRLHHALRRSVQGVSYAFVGARAPERNTRRVSFAPPPDAPEVDPFANPLEQFRRFLHFPLAAMCLRIPIDASPVEWSGVRLRFHLSTAWPAGLGVAPRSFLPHAVPMINLRRDLAEPMPVDGTKARAEIAHPDSPKGYRLRELFAVYRSTPEGLVPLLPEALRTEGEAYAVEVSGRNHDRQVWLDLQLPSAFDEPTSVVAEGDWFQPTQPGLFDGELRAEPASRHIERVRWQVERPVQEAAESPLGDRRDRLARLLELSAKTTLDAPSLTFLLDVMGGGNSEIFSRVARHIATVTSDSGPDAGSPSGQKRLFVVRMKRLPPTLRPAADLLFSRLPGFLAAWCAETAVNVRVHLEGEEGELDFAHVAQEVVRGQ